MLIPVLGTNGLGAAATRMLASRNPARIYITGRKEAAAQQIISDIKSAGSTTDVTWIRCDHDSLASVQEAADKVLAQESRLDVLMANAGVSKHTPDCILCGTLVPACLAKDDGLSNQPCAPDRRSQDS